jgi:hypothetical protein
MPESRPETSGAGAPGTLNPPTSRAKPGVDAGAHCIAPCPAQARHFSGIFFEGSRCNAWPVPASPLAKGNYVKWLFCIRVCGPVFMRQCAGVRVSFAGSAVATPNLPPEVFPRFNLGLSLIAADCWNRILILQVSPNSFMDTEITVLALVLKGESSPAKTYSRENPI